MYADVLAAGGYTLVVGAGINASRNVPGWGQLVERAWLEVFGAESVYPGSLAERLPEARAAVEKHCGWLEEDAQRLGVTLHPLEPQFALELIDLELKYRGDRKNLLPTLLARHLYENVALSEGPDTLSELARFVRRSKRLIRVISLNVDNLLEIEVERTRPANGETRYLQVVSRSRHRPRGGVAIYHLHGFLPIDNLERVPRWARQKWSIRGRKPAGVKSSQEYEHMRESVPEGLVFTDSQYWTSVATPLSFANFIFANALHDSSCIFIGLSMTDLNIIRWLGLHASEFHREYERELGYTGADARVPSPYIRHCWIRPDSSDPTGLLTRFLSHRGVDSYSLPSWEPFAVRTSLQELLRDD